MCNRSKETARVSLTFHHEIILSDLLWDTGRLQLGQHRIDQFDGERLDVFGFETGVAECVNKRDPRAREQ